MQKNINAQKLKIAAGLIFNESPSEIVAILSGAVSFVVVSSGI
jgi:hypothetical protein